MPTLVYSDATVGLGKSSLKPGEWQGKAIEDMTPGEWNTATDWSSFYEGKYEVVGTLVDDNGEPYYKEAAAPSSSEAAAAKASGDEAKKAS